MAQRTLLHDRIAVLAGLEDLYSPIALGLARQGAHLVLGGECPGACGDAATRARALGSQVLEAEALEEVAPTDRGRRLIEQALAAFGRVDVLVSGLGRVAEEGIGEVLSETDLSIWRPGLDVGLFGPLQLIQAALRPMRAQGSGAIVMIGAVEERLAEERSGVVTLARGALLAATRMLAREIGPDGIRINTVVPGHLDGPRLEAGLERRAEREGTDARTLHRALVDEHALRRLPEPGEIADAVAFLASDLARVVTGQSLDVNCGHYFH